MAIHCLARCEQQGAGTATYIRKHGQENSYLSAYWVDDKRCDVSRDDMSKAIQEAGRALNYPRAYGIDITHLNTHSLRAGGEISFRKRAT